MSSPDQIVHEFEMGRVGTVRASLGEYGGKQRIDVRIWVEPRDRPGAALIATPKGISLPVEYADDLLELVEALWRASKQTTTALGQRRVRRLLEIATGEPAAARPALEARRRRKAKEA